MSPPNASTSTDTDRAGRTGRAAHAGRSAPADGREAAVPIRTARPHPMGIHAAPGAAIDASPAARAAVLAYGVFAYVLFLATFVYAVGFLGGFLVPTRLDGPLAGPLGPALLADVALLLLFAVQHSVMARPWFKRRITRVIPETAERSTYVLLSSVALIALFAWWRPLGGVVWDVGNPVARAALQAVFAAGLLTVLVTTFLINHFDLFGLRQSWLQFRGRAAAPLGFVTPGPYRVIRHPLYVGWMAAFWAAPTMTAAHLLFAAATTIYMLVAIRWEERDLIAAHPEYAAHRKRVPMLVPRLGAR
jgi:methanethiol S-methyltransferase